MRKVAAALFFLLASFPLLSRCLPDSSERKIIISGITLIGNGITRDKVVLREMAVRKGDTVLLADLPGRLNRSRENLLNTSLFNFVTLHTLMASDSVHAEVFVDMKERWYIWPAPILEVQERNFNVWWEHRDFNRLNYGGYLNWNNFRGRNEQLSLIARFGYTERYEIYYSFPYIDKKQTTGLGLSVSYYRNHEVAFETFNNQLDYLKDERNYIRTELISKMSFTYRREIYNSHVLQLRYADVQAGDTLLSKTENYFTPGQTRLSYLSLGYAYKCDHRDSKAYPLRGYYLDLEIVKDGLGILQHEGVDLVSFSNSLRYYDRIGSRLYFSAGLKYKISSEKLQPYYVQRALGYGDYVRGYEYYVIDGQSFSLARLNLRWELVRPHVKKIPNLSSEKFNTFHYALYGGIFADGAKVNDEFTFKNNPLANQYLYGYGAGLDLVTYYDLVFRFEFSWNHLGEYGLFVHFNAPL